MRYSVLKTESVRQHLYFCTSKASKMSTCCSSWLDLTRQVVCGLPQFTDKETPRVLVVGVDAHTSLEAELSR